MGSISYSDHLFGILLKALQDNGYADSTAVFVFADHGDYTGDYGLVEKWPSGLEVTTILITASYFTAEISFLIKDVLTRVPLLVRMPGGAENHVVEEQVFDSTYQS
jgi:choline-sulfatase